MMRESFRRFAIWTAYAAGSPYSFLLAVVILIVWALLGPRFHYSDTWQLVINTGTSVVTFLMVFLIQHTQNRDSKAMQIKLDELLRAVTRARTDLVDLESADDEQLEKLKQEFTELREHLTRHLATTEEKKSERQPAA